MEKGLLLAKRQSGIQSLACESCAIARLNSARISRLTGASGDAHFEAPAEDSRCGFDLVKPRDVALVDSLMVTPRNQDEQAHCALLWQALARIAIGKSGCFLIEDLT